MEKERTQNKSKVLLLLLLLLFTVAIVTFVVLFSNAKYIASGTDTKTEVQVGKWAVKVNGTDITAPGASLDGDIKLTPIHSADVADGVMVPGSIAYADVTIDMTGSQVSGAYSATIDPAAVALALPGFSVLGVQDNAPATAPTTAPAGLTPGSTISGKIAYSATAGAMTKTVRVFVQWTDRDPSVAQNLVPIENAKDTAAGILAGTATCPVTVVVDQFTPIY